MRLGASEFLVLTQVVHVDTAVGLHPCAERSGWMRRDVVLDHLGGPVHDLIPDALVNPARLVEGFPPRVAQPLLSRP